MSYDIELQINTGGGRKATVYEVGNYTRNVSAMWTKALGRSLSTFHDATAKAAASELRFGIAAMEADPEAYRAMEPPNGWGSYDGALAYLRRLAEACEEHPGCTIWISC